METLTSITLVSCCVIALTLSVLALLILRPSSAPSPFRRDERQPRRPIEHDEDKRRAVLKVGYVPERVPRDLDAIVIGSGLGGLVAAALLAKAGKRVCVFEQHDQAGGCLHTFTEGGLEFDTGQSILSRFGDCDHLLYVFVQPGTLCRRSLCRRDVVKGRSSLPSRSGH
jgi:hypothetical protein